MHNNLSTASGWTVSAQAVQALYTCLHTGLDNFDAEHPFADTRQKALEIVLLVYLFSGTTKTMREVTHEVSGTEHACLHRFCTCLHNMYARMSAHMYVCARVCTHVCTNVYTQSCGLRSLIAVGD